MIYAILILMIFLISILIILPRMITAWHARNIVYTDAVEVPLKRAAIVFGAGLRRDGRPTTVLRDRVAAAADLYFAGKIEKILMSGDNQFSDYNEPGAMRDYAMELGVPEDDIALDYAGRRTYDTCFRARDIFGLNEAVLVTQSFHLPRALYTCRALEISAVGFNADQRDYHRRSRAFWNLREIPASLVAMYEVHISHPQPVLGNPEPIFPMEAQ